MKIVRDKFGGFKNSCYLCVIQISQQEYSCAIYQLPTLSTQTHNHEHKTRHAKHTTRTRHTASTDRASTDTARPDSTRAARHGRQRLRPRMRMAQAVPLLHRMGMVQRHQYRAPVPAPAAESQLPRTPLERHHHPARLYGHVAGCAGRRDDTVRAERPHLPGTSQIHGRNQSRSNTLLHAHNCQ